MHRSGGTVAALVALVVLFAPPAAHATTYEVGPGRAYANLQAVQEKVVAGDLVLVDGGSTYPGGATFETDARADAPVTIRGVASGGARPVISGGSNTIELAGDHYVLENLDITGGTARCLYHHAHAITVRDTVVHDCPSQGILGADNDSGSLTLQRVEVHHAGNGTQGHSIYMASDENAHPGSVFRMEHCWVHDTTGGNAVKSRAERNEIYYNWIEGALFHELELIGPDPAGGVPENRAREDSDVVGNVLRKTNDAFVIRIGGDGTGQSRGRYRFAFNTILTRPGGAAAFRVHFGLESAEMHGNVLHTAGGGPVNVMRDVEGEWVAGRRVVAGEGNWVTTGSTNVPPEWTQTQQAATPGFTDEAALDLRPLGGSLLEGRGPASPASPAGFAFPGPLHPPAFQPVRALLAPGTAPTRPVNGVIDIGAFESGSAAAPAPAPGPSGGPPAGPNPGAVAARARLERAGRVRVRYRGTRLVVHTGIRGVCLPGGPRCRITASIRRGQGFLGRLNGTVSAGRSRLAVVGLKPVHAGRLLRAGRLRVTLRVAIGVPGARMVRERFGATLRVPARVAPR